MSTYEYEVQGYYGGIYGWECLCTEDTRDEAEQRLAEYDANEPGTPHRIKRVRS
jgi:hypothetical protein